MPSITQLEKLLALDPNDAFILYGLAQEYAKHADVTRAVEFYDRCLTADPGYCYAYFHKAKALNDHGKQPEAVATLRQGLAVARRTNDQHAASEIQGFLDELT